MTEVEMQSSPRSATHRALPIQFLYHLLLGVMLTGVLALLSVLVLLGLRHMGQVAALVLGIVAAMAAWTRSGLGGRLRDWVCWITVLTLAMWVSAAAALLAFWSSVTYRPIPVRWHLPGIALVLVLTLPVLAILAGRSGKQRRSPAKWWFKAAGVAAGVGLSVMWLLGLHSLLLEDMFTRPRVVLGRAHIETSANAFVAASEAGPTPTIWAELVEYGGHSRAGKRDGQGGQVFLCEHLGRIVRADFATLPGQRRREILRRIDPEFGSGGWPGDACVFWWPSYRPADGRYLPAAWRGGSGWLTHAELEASIGALVRRAEEVARGAAGTQPAQMRPDAGRERPHSAARAGPGLTRAGSPGD